MNPDYQNRLKSWALWTSIAALVVFCVKQFAGLDISQTVNGLLDVLLPVLVGFGIVNNPTDKNHL
ncbi:MAG: holin [Clostridia bacterium]|nr:holin [Clostridia bacterium]